MVSVYSFWGCQRITKHGLRPVGQEAVVCVGCRWGRETVSVFFDGERFVVEVEIVNVGGFISGVAGRGSRCFLSVF